MIKSKQKLNKTSKNKKMQNKNGTKLNKMKTRQDKLDKQEMAGENANEKN